MRRYLVLAAVAIAVMFAGQASYAADAVYYPPQVTGKKVRRQVRHFLYPRNLRGDKRRVYDEYGFTPYRLRINAYGRVTERWRYPRHGIEYVFDSEGMLLSERRIPVETCRRGIYH